MNRVQQIGKSGSSSRSGAPLNRAIVISVLVIIGVLATYVSGLLLSFSSVPSSISQHGVPLPWVTSVGSYCIAPPPGYTCLSSSTTSYDWISFLGDVLFYIAVLYGLYASVLGVRKAWNEALNRAKQQAEQSQSSKRPEPEEESEQ